MAELVEPGTYWFARFLFYRGLFLTYFLAFLVAYRQFIPLAGENGLLPFTEILDQTSFSNHPTLLHFFPSDKTIHCFSIIGLILSTVGFFGIEWLGSFAVAGVLLVLWGMYLSLVHGGRLFYGYGWESFLCETGFLAVFLGGAYTTTPVMMTFLMAWLLFRIMFGAGLIKIRGDQCWRDLTCMEYHYETQPMPNPFSWLAHHLPRWWHKFETFVNHVVELAVPFLYFAPQPISGVAGAITIGFQGWLMVTGNFSWLNFLTGILAIGLLPDSFFFGIEAYLQPDHLSALSLYHELLIWAYTGLVIILSYAPTMNLLSKSQAMNASFEPFKLVNTYGAFGSITKSRYELVVQGRHQDGPWKTYEFKGKPTDPERRPPQWAPYHLRLDWQMWFAAMRSRPRLWLVKMAKKLLENDEGISSLLRNNPFREVDPPDQVRILRYIYEYTSYDEFRDGGRWWNRRQVGETLPAMDKNRINSYLGR
ncbi:MAG: lipase maturation factor family protein [bacterium]